ncbi:MAG TPA: DUF1302 family protein [Solimonas sp.]|nr:DUF1302 family protein [Solimonas sp.]
MTVSRAMQARRLPALGLALSLAALLAPGTAMAVEFELGETGVTANLRTELSVGARWRMQDRDSRLLGKLNVDGQQQLCGVEGADCLGVDGNERFKNAPGNVLQDYDNGNLNYDKHDLVQASSRFSAKLGLSYEDYGLFVRGIAWYDPVNADFDQSHPDTTFQPASTQRPQSVVGEIAERYELMEAYVYGSLPFFADETLNLRLGNQIVYWGESNFLVLNSLNTVNPPSANRVEFVGSNQDEIFTSVPMLLASTQMFDVEAELFYQFGWEPIELEPVGSYYSTADNIGAGGNFAHLDGKVSEDPMNLAAPNGPLSQAGRTFYRTGDREPGEGGQYGVRFKYFAETLGEGTTFGLYFANYHSRLPVASFVAAQESSCRAAPEALDAVPGGAAVLPFCLLGEPIPVDTIQYFLEYPEDVQMFGVSAVTTAGVWAFQFEYAYRPNLPVQVDDVDLVYAALQPAFPRQDVQAIVATIPGVRHAVPDYVETRYRGHTVRPGDIVRGYERLKVGQLNLNALLLTPTNPFGASQVTLLVEAGLTHVLDFPSLDQIQFDGPGTSNHYSAAIDGTGDPTGQTDPNRTNVTQQTDGFATEYSWGYHLYSELEYPDLLFGLTFKPILHFGHDVSGTAPGNGGNFIEGRQQADVALNVRATELWSAQLQYTWYRGAGEFNLLRDRDNASLFVQLNF